MSKEIAPDFKVECLKLIISGKFVESGKTLAGRLQDRTEAAFLVVGMFLTCVDTAMYQLSWVSLILSSLMLGWLDSVVVSVAGKIAQNELRNQSQNDLQPSWIVDWSCIQMLMYPKHFRHITKCLLYSWQPGRSCQADLYFKLESVQWCLKARIDGS